jgi:hypothetical protein
MPSTAEFIPAKIVHEYDDDVGGRNGICSSRQQRHDARQNWGKYD